SAEIQLPPTPTSRVVRIIRRKFVTSQRTTAPEKTRTNVNEAASMLVCFSAARQRSELLAKAIIAAKVRIRTRALNEKRIRVKRNDVICDDACHLARRVVDMSRGDR